MKWIEDRREHLLATNHARDAECELEIACDKDGTIRALRGRAFTDQGAYIRTNGPTAARNIAQVLTGPYRIPHVRIDVSLMMTNKTPSGTYRGPGRFEADFFRERLFDIAAADLGLDRVAFRRRNLIAEAEMPYRLATVAPLNIGTETDSGDYGATLARCLEEIDWTAKAAIQGKLIDGRYRGTAIGCYLEGGASGPKESARLVLEADGKVSVHVGSSSIGQGLETVCAQIAADALEISMQDIRAVHHGSTDDVIEGYGSYSSRSVVMGGNALVMAAGGCATPFAMPPPSAGTVPPKTYRSMPARRWHPTDDHCRSAPSPERRRSRPMPATSAPTAMAHMPPMLRWTPRPAGSSFSTTSRSRMSDASSIR